MKKSFWILIIGAILLAGCKSNRAVTPSQRDDHRDSTVPIMSAQVKDLIKEARRWIGTPYVWGGQTMSGTDCSGFVLSVFRNAYGLNLPRTSAMQRDYAQAIQKQDLLPGDLVFFCTSGGPRVSHVGLYIGSGRFIHASSSRGVTESGLDERYYREHFHSAGRVISPEKIVIDNSQSVTIADRRELKQKIKQLEKEKKQLQKGQSKPVNPRASKPKAETKKEVKIDVKPKQEPVQTDTTYVDTDPSIFD